MAYPSPAVSHEWVQDAAACFPRKVVSKMGTFPLKQAITKPSSADAYSAHLWQTVQCWPTSSPQ